MGLYARITATDSTKISVHRFGAALREWAAGAITRTQIINAIGLSGAELTELDAIKATYDALGTGNASAAFTKAAFLDRLEDVFLFCETGDYSEAQAKARLGF